MKFKKPITVLTVLIALLSLIAAIYGVIPGQGKSFEFKSLSGQAVTIYGRGLYKNDSVSIASQAVGQDAVTLALGIPLLLISLYLFRKGFTKGKLLLTGILGYFLYTYVSYSFLAMYNSVFLIYVAIMSLSFYAFTLSMMSFDLKLLSFKDGMPVKLVGGLLIFIAGILGLMWLKMIITPLLSGTVPTALEHYTTLTIQAMDLGFVIPAAVLSGILIIKRHPFGYLLATVMTIKETALLASITAMIVSQIAAGVMVSGIVTAAFSLFDIVIITCLVIILKNVKENTTA